MLNKLPITVVIPTYNRPESLKYTIDNIINKQYIPDEIIVIDQSKNNKTKECIYNNYKDIVKYHYLNKPSSTHSRNIGIKLAKNNLLIFSDDDVLVNEDTIKNIYDIFMSDEKIGLIAALDENYQKLSFSRNFLASLLLRKYLIEEKGGYVTRSIFGRYPQKTVINRTYTKWAMGYFFAVRKDLINKYNIRFDEKMESYAYAEDLDFTYSLYKKSRNEEIKFILDPYVKVKHLVSKEYRTEDYKKTLIFVVYRKYLQYKHFNDIISTLMTNWANVGEFLMRLAQRRNPEYVIKAMYICYKNKKSLKNGIIPEHIFKGL